MEKRKTRTLIEMVNVMLCNFDLGKSVWGEVLLTTCATMDLVFVQCLRRIHNNLRAYE